ncbi:hypothetical protein T459_25732 [Capsicum annuum]|uniref:Uncharacterized protein n=1 Tax=Capsicum annuum TaxID=4072 RepID=A0A2G2YLJ7_CAPAN|nr:putative Polygalacturonase precursor [Capsicum annuum]PHT70628.1 hypothetical protein T459_25732 [Capsicum annuum]
MYAYTYTRKIENFNKNVGALSVKLNTEDMKELESYASGDVVKGERRVRVANLNKLIRDSAIVFLESLPGV